jgi:hypothetical protein
MTMPGYPQQQFHPGLVVVRVYTRAPLKRFTTAPVTLFGPTLAEF